MTIIVSTSGGARPARERRFVAATLFAAALAPAAIAFAHPAVADPVPSDLEVYQ